MKLDFYDLIDNMNVHKNPPTIEFMWDVVKEVKCGGLAFDKFGNLFYTDMLTSSVNKIDERYLRMLIKDAQDDLPPSQEIKIEELYSAKTTPTAQSMTDIAIEREFLYWTNNLGLSRFGSVHKAFTEPFIGKE